MVELFPLGITTILQIMYRSLFPKHQEAPLTKRVRIVRVTKAHTVVQSLDIPAVHWTFITSRLPATWQVGTEATVTFTPMELEYLQGKRELET